MTQQEGNTFFCVGIFLILRWKPLELHSLASDSDENVFLPQIFLQSFFLNLIHIYLLLSDSICQAKKRAQCFLKDGFVDFITSSD